MPKFKTGAEVNNVTRSGGISTNDFLPDGTIENLWNRIVGEQYIKASLSLLPPEASLSARLGPLRFGNGGSVMEEAANVTSKFLGFNDRVGSNITGYVEAMLGMDMPSMRTYFDWDYDGPSIGGGGLLGGRVVPGILAEGGHIDPMVVNLLTELVDAVREGQDTEVNVFTDLRGESRAAVTDFRSEIRERDLRGLRTA